MSAGLEDSGKELLELVWCLVNVQLQDVFGLIFIDAAIDFGEQEIEFGVSFAIFQDPCFADHTEQLEVAFFECELASFADRLERLSCLSWVGDEGGHECDAQLHGCHVSFGCLGIGGDNGAPEVESIGLQHGSCVLSRGGAFGGYFRGA